MLRRTAGLGWLQMRTPAARYIWEINDPGATEEETRVHVGEGSLTFNRRRAVFCRKAEFITAYSPAGLCLHNHSAQPPKLINLTFPEMHLHTDQDVQ